MSTNQTDPERSDWLTVAETGAVLKVGTRKVNDLIEQGRLRAVKLGHRTVRVSAASVDALDQDNRTAI